MSSSALLVSPAQVKKRQTDDMKNEGADIQATEAYEAERKKVEDARAALPDVETLLSLDELQVRLCSCPIPAMKPGSS
jgi:hypothetical protein